MDLRQRRHEEITIAPPTVGPTAQGDLRLRAERLLASGADAIDRALSQDSARFLSENQQEGGQ